MIASILNIRPLTERQATKAEVKKRMSSVGLIHIVAYGNKPSGKIALSPNPGWASKFPQRKDYMLKMSDVQAANIQAFLVVLSCFSQWTRQNLEGLRVLSLSHVPSWQLVLVLCWWPCRQ